MRERGSRPVRLLGDVIKDVVKAAPWSRRKDLFALTEAWCQAAGPEVARRTQVMGLSRGTLTVNVESAALRHEIEAYRRPEILRRLQEAYPQKRIVALKCVLRPPESI